MVKTLTKNVELRIYKFTVHPLIKITISLTQSFFIKLFFLNIYDCLLFEYHIYRIFSPIFQGTLFFGCL